MNLVKIEGQTYTFYKNSERVVKIAAESPLNKVHLEEYRKDPIMLKAEVEYNTYGPREYVEANPVLYVAAYYDGSEEAKTTLIESFPDVFTLERLAESDTGYYVYSQVTEEWSLIAVENFNKMFKEV